MRLQIFSNEYGEIVSLPDGAATAWCALGMAKTLIESDARVFLPNAHIEIHSATVSERRNSECPQS